MPSVSPVGVAANGTVAGMRFRRLLAAGFRFCNLDISHLPSCSPWLHRVLLHGFIATMRALTSAGPLQPTFPVSPCSLPFDGRYSVDRPGPLVKQCPSLLVLTVRRPRPVPDRSPCLSRLTFRPFHLQPPSRHFVTVAFIRYITAVTCRVYPPGRLKGRWDRRRTVKGSDIARSLPDRLGRIEFTYVTDWSFVSGCSPPFLTETQLPLSTTGW